MAAYLIVHRREIKNGEHLKKYAEGVDETIARYDGKVVVRTDRFDILEGHWHPGRKGDDRLPERLTVIEFPDMDRLKAWYASGEYAPLKRIRQESAACEVAAVEGKPA